MEHLDFMILGSIPENILSLSGINNVAMEDQKQKVLFKLIGLYLYNEEKIKSPDLLSLQMIERTLEIKNFSDFAKYFEILHAMNPTKKVYKEILKEYFSQEGQVFVNDVESSLRQLSKKIESN